MPTHLPASAAHALWVVAVMIVAHTTAQVWAAHHSQSALAQAVAIAVP